MSKPGPKPRPVRHGTKGGYNAHRRRGEQACAACLAANRQAGAEARQRMRERGELRAALAP